MSQLHQLVPLSDEMRGAQFAAFLGGPVPDGVRLGRYPTADEIRAAFGRLNESVRHMVQDKSGKSWSLAVMDGTHEALRIDARLRGQTEMLFTVSGDRHLLEALVAQLPRNCGSFLIMTDGQNPVIVTAEG